MKKKGPGNGSGSVSVRVKVRIVVRDRSVVILCFIISYTLIDIRHLVTITIPDISAIYMLSSLQERRGYEAVGTKEAK